MGHIYPTESGVTSFEREMGIVGSGGKVVYEVFNVAFVPQSDVQPLQ